MATARVRTGAAQAGPVDDNAPADRPPAKGVALVTDNQGRQFAARKWTPLERMRFLRLIDGISNETYIGYATIACATIEIDGELCRMPTSINELEARVQLLGDDALNKIGDALAVLFEADRENAAPKLMAAAKN